MHASFPTPLATAGTTTLTFGQAAVLGVAANAAHGDHGHGMPDTAWEHIATQTLAAPAASVSFASLSAAFKAFRLTIEGIPTAALAAQLRFNNDAVTLCPTTYVYGITTPAAGALARAADTFVVLHDQTGTVPNPGAGIMFAGQVIITKETAAARASIIGQMSGGVGGTPNVMLISAQWADVANLINRMDVIASASTFAVGSRFVLEGCRK